MELPDSKPILAIFGGLGGLAFLCYYAIKTGSGEAIGAVVAISTMIFRDFFESKRRETEKESE